MKLNRIITALSLVALLPIHASAQAPKYSNEFLAIGVGARGLGMSGAQSALVDDATSAYWNPAGLCHVKSNLQLYLMHSVYFADIAKYDYASIVAPVDEKRVVGLSIIRFAVDDIPNTLDLIDKDGTIDYNKLKTFSAADYAFLFSYAQKTKITGLTLGGNVKVVHRIVGDFAKAWGFGLDAGVQYEHNHWKFAAVGKDITSTFNAWTYNTTSLQEVYAETGNEIPQNGLEITLPRAILGTAYKFDVTKKVSIQPALDADFTFDGMRNVPIKSKVVSIDPKMGIEFGYDNFIFLRAGVCNFQKVKNIDNSTSTTFQPNMGLGIRLRNLTIDYALTNFGNSSQTLSSNVFSLRLNIYRQHKLPAAATTK